MSKDRPRTLTGYLGGDIEIRETAARMEPQEETSWDSVAEMWVTEDKPHYRRARPYGRVSLATRRYEQGEEITTWHQLVIWDLHRMDRFEARRLRKGDRVRVEGYEQTFLYTPPGEEEPRELCRFIVTRLEILRRRFANGLVLHFPRREQPSNTEPKAPPQLSPAETIGRGYLSSARFTLSVAVAAPPFRKEGKVFLEVETQKGKTFRTAAPLGTPQAEALAWLQKGDAVRLTFERSESFPKLLEVAWDWQHGEPQERTGSASHLLRSARPISLSPPPALPAEVPSEDSSFAGQLASDPRTEGLHRSAALETYGGDLLEIRAPLGSPAAAELAYLQEGDGLRVLGQLEGDLLAAHAISPSYLRGLGMAR